MSLFEYIMVLTSIIIGLGITELLTGLVRIFRSTHEEGFFFPQAMWGLFLFFHLIIIWWTRWDLRDSLEWTFLELLLSLTAPTLLYILGGLVFPYNRSSVEHYYRHRIRFFNILSVVVVVDYLHETLIEGSAYLSLVTFILSLVLVSTLVCRFSEDAKVHGVAALVSIASLTGYVMFADFVLR